MPETQDPVEPPPEKAYCCGNSTQREATLIAKFDLVIIQRNTNKGRQRVLVEGSIWVIVTTFCLAYQILSLVFLSLVLAILIIITSNPEYFPDIVKNTPGNVTTDLSEFLQWPREFEIRLSLVPFN